MKAKQLMREVIKEWRKGIPSPEKFDKLSPAEKDRLLALAKRGVSPNDAADNAVIMKDASGNKTRLTEAAADFAKPALKKREPVKEIERDPEVEIAGKERAEDGKDAVRKAAENAARQLARYKEGNDLVDSWTVTEHRLAQPDNTPER